MLDRIFPIFNINNSLFDDILKICSGTNINLVYIYKNDKVKYD